MESEIGVTLPKYLIETLSKYPAGHSDKELIDTPIGEKVFDCLFSFNEDSDFYILEEYKTVIDEYNTLDYLPFGTDAAGNLFLISLRTKFQEVFILDHESGKFHFITDNFLSFLEMLKEDTE